MFFNIVDILPESAKKSLVINIAIVIFFPHFLVLCFIFEGFIIDYLVQVSSNVKVSRQNRIVDR